MSTRQISFNSISKPVKLPDFLFYVILLYMANNYSEKTRNILKEAGVIQNKNINSDGAMAIIKETEKERRLNKLTPENKVFLDNWLKTGNPIASYKKAYRIKSDFRATERSAVLISKYRGVILSALKEKMGINEVLYFERLMSMLNAKKVLFTKFGGKQVVPDNQARIKALQMLGDALNLQKKESGEGKGLNLGIGTVNIYKSKEEGIFSVRDSVDGEIVP